jgi:glycosyltransferase involved in cell wall biosynthesis
MLVSNDLQKNPGSNQSTYSGHLDQVSGRLIEGWACCQSLSDSKLEVVSVDIYDYNRLLGTVRADKFRSDLLEVGIGQGEHAFFYKLPIEIFDGVEHVISARISGTDFILPGSPRILKRPPLSLAEAFDGPSKALLHERPLSDFQFVVLKSLAMLMETVSIQSRNLEAQSEALKLLLNRQNLPGSSGLGSPEHAPKVDYGPIFEEASNYLGEAGDIIFFSIIDWNFRTQRPQHLAKNFSKLGYRVIYISVQFDDVDLSVAPFKVISSPAAGIFEVRLACSSPLPNIYNGIEAKTQLRELCQSLDSLVRKLNIKGPVAFIQFPSWLPLALSLSGGLLVHDCLDHIAGFNNVSGYVVDQEHMLIEQADIVVTTSTYLHDFVAKKRANEIIRNAAEVEYFSKMPDKLAIDKTKPVVGYFGAISEWFDIELVEFCALRNPDLDFVLIGRVDENIDLRSLPSLPNVKFYGEQPYEVLTSYLYSFDVCIIPFKVVELIQATNPVKVYEYLSSGKPVVSADIPEVRAMSSYVYIAKDDLEFDSCIRTALSENDEALSVSRINWVRQQSWDARALDYVDLFKKVSPKVSIVILCYNNIEYTKACLGSVIKFNDYNNCEIVCVNNGSTDETAEYLDETCSRCELEFNIVV